MPAANTPSNTTRALWQIHFCVLLWGFTAILGKLITLPALPLVWWRMLIVVATLALLPKVWRGLLAMPARTRWAYAGIGVLVALHWLTFYGAIKLANASVAATCIAFATPITALLEPLFTRQRFRPGDLLLGMVSLPGIWLVVGGVPANKMCIRDSHTAVRSSIWSDRARWNKYRPHPTHCATLSRPPGEGL